METEVVLDDLIQNVVKTVKDYKKTHPLIREQAADTKVFVVLQ